MNNNILALASQIITACAANDKIELLKVCQTLNKEINTDTQQNTDDFNYSGFLKFTNKEISKMPKSFKHTFIAEGKVIYYRKRKRGQVSYSYEARYRRHGYNISVSSTSLIELKDKFIKALHRAETGYEEPTVPDTFHEFAMYYFENFRKRKVKQLTYENDMYRYNNHIKPVFGSVKLKKIMPAQCQALIDKYCNKGQSKTADEVYSLLNVIFKTAIAHGIMDRNPLAIVIKERHQREHGKALTYEEEKTLLNKTKGTKYQILFAVALYTGMRPNEYKTARIDDLFIIAVNSKRKSNKTEYKRIPITPKLKPFLANVNEFKFPQLEYMREKLKEILPNHKLYDLRTTFYTRCQECGVADVARMEFVGHSLGTLGDTYTDLSDEFLLKEAQKLDY